MAEGLGQKGEKMLQSRQGLDSDCCSASGEERRRWPRRPAERLLAYSWLDQENRPLDMGMAKTVDLSEGGVGILIHRALVGGQTLHLFMAVEEHLVETTARIVYQRPLHGGQYQIGACFISMEDKGRRYLSSSNLET